MRSLSRSFVVAWLSAAACSPPAPASEEPPTGSTGKPTGGADEPTTTGEPTSDPSTSTSDPDPTTSTTDPEATHVTLRGAVQKGPFILGTSVEVAPLQADASPSGLQFEVAIDNDRGEFEVTDVPVGLVAIRAEGFHFDEVSGGLSKASLTLRALHRAAGAATTINLHPLTHLVEPRARALLKGGADLDAALLQAQGELVAQLEIGAPGLTLDLPVGQASVAGADVLDNAYALAVGAVFARHAHSVSPDAPDAALQSALNTAALDLADGALTPALREQLALAEHQLDPAAVQQALDGRLAALGLPPGPDIRRALDQDDDGLANLVDNCPLHVNVDQQDGDTDGLGDACDPCPGSALDTDGDGMQDACDLCPTVDNAPTMDPDGPDKDKDGDGIPNGCDSCWRSAKTGAVADENCCDPREDEPADCSLPQMGDPEFVGCILIGERFDCGPTYCAPPPSPLLYRSPCTGNCGDYNLCVPGSALLPWPQCPQGVGCYCDETMDCYTQFCTVGDDSECGFNEDIQCVAYYHPGDAPAGLEDLGICMRADAGACAGKFGVDCVL